MKIIGISDLHGNLISIPRCDVLCIAGDIIPLNIQKDYTKSDKWWKTKFIEWSNSINCNKIFITPGNHDFYIEYVYNKGYKEYKEFIDTISALTINKVEILIDTITEYKGITFYGCPWIQSIDFQQNKWAFEEYNTEYNNIYSKIPECDILITHDSPLKNELLNIESWNKHKYHLYGHWHEGKNINSENKYNCSILDDMYNLKRNYKLVEINIDVEKTKFELLQEFAEKIKEYAATTLQNNEEYKKLCCEIDSIFTQTLENPKDKEDEISWNESEIINCFDYNDEIDIDDEYK